MPINVEKEIIRTNERIELAQFTYEIYEYALLTLREAVKILSDMTFDTEQLESGVTRMGYRQQTNHSHVQALNRTERFFEPFDKWTRKRARELKSNNRYSREGDAYRIAEREWYQQTTDALEHALANEDGVDFWLEHEIYDQTVFFKLFKQKQDKVE
jgi:hypothetical protein